MCLKKFNKTMNKKIKKLDVYDIGMIKFGVLAMTLMIAKLWSPILSLDWYWYLIIAVIVLIRPMKKFYFK